MDLEREQRQRFRPTGYDAPELDEPAGEAPRRKFDALIRGKVVELGSAYRVDRGRLVCDVFLNGKNLADYFPEYQ